MQWNQWITQHCEIKERERGKGAHTHVYLVKCVSSREVAKHPGFMEVDELGHVVDAPEIGLCVPRQDLPTVHHGLPRDNPATKLNRTNLTRFATGQFNKHVGSNARSGASTQGAGS